MDILWRDCFNAHMYTTQQMDVSVAYSSNTSCYNSITLRQRTPVRSASGSTYRGLGPVTNLNLNSAPVPRSEFHHWRYWEQSDTSSKKKFCLSLPIHQKWSDHRSNQTLCRQHCSALRGYYGLRKASYDMRRKISTNIPLLFKHPNGCLLIITM